MASKCFSDRESEKNNSYGNVMIGHDDRDDVDFNI